MGTDRRRQRGAGGAARENTLSGGKGRHLALFLALFSSFLATSMHCPAEEKDARGARAHGNSLAPHRRVKT